MQDGFFDGELLFDGRRGLVPSNFVEKLVGDDLLDFHQRVVLGRGESQESLSTSLPQDLDFNSTEELLMGGWMRDEVGWVDEGGGDDWLCGL